MFKPKKNTIIALPNLASNVTSGRPTDALLIEEFQNNKRRNFSFKLTDLTTCEVILFSDAYPEITNNLANIAGVLKAVQYCQERSLDFGVMTRNETVLAWLKNGKINTNTFRNELNIKFFNDLNKSIKWLEENELMVSIFKF